MLEFSRYFVLLHFNFSFFDSFVVGLLRLGLHYRLHLSLKCGSVPREAIALLSSYELIWLSAVDMKSFQCSPLILIFIVRFCVFIPELNIRNLWTNILFFMLVSCRRVCVCVRVCKPEIWTKIWWNINFCFYWTCAVSANSNNTESCLFGWKHCVAKIRDTHRTHN